MYVPGSSLAARPEYVRKASVSRTLTGGIVLAANDFRGGGACHHMRLVSTEQHLAIAVVTNYGQLQGQATSIADTW